MTKKTHENEVTFEEKFNDYGEYENTSNEEMDYSITNIETAPNYKERDTYESYDDDPDKSNFIKRMFIGLIIITVIIIIILLLLKGCTRGGKLGEDEDLESKLLKAGKNYYSELSDELPSSNATCKIVTLNTLKELKYLGNEYDECDGEKTYVKVCLLESGKYHYLPVMLCDSITTNFTDSKDGTETNIVADKTDVTYLYKASYLDETTVKYGKEEEFWKDEIPYTNYKTVSTTNYYRYRDKEYTWTLRKRYYYPGDKTNASEISTYYAKYPANNYINSTGKTTAYRWYTLGNKEYYPNGAYGYELNQPSGYPYYDESESIAYIYYQSKAWTEQGKPTTNSPTKMYVCVNPSKPNVEFYSYEECSSNANEKYNQGYTTTKRVIYTCNAGLTEVSQTSTCKVCTVGKLNYEETSCGYYASEWSSPTSTKCNTNYSSVCKTVTYVMKRWYKADIEYYGNTSPTGQVPYYKTAPVEGAVKDENTATTVFKWYKLVDGGVTTNYTSTSPAQDAVKTADFKWGEWTKFSTNKPETIKGSREIEKKTKVKVKQIISNGETKWIEISDKYLTEQELIIKLQKAGYKVKSIEEVMLTKDIKIQVKLTYRDRV